MTDVPERLYTQADVDALVRRALEKVAQSFFPDSDPETWTEEEYYGERYAMRIFNIITREKRDDEN